MQRGAAGLVIGLLLGCASAPDGEAPEAALVTPLPLIEGAEAVLEHGEVVEYAVSWGILPVGTVSYRTTREMREDRAWIRIDGETRPSALVAAFAKVGGSMRTWIDPETLLPEVSLWTTLEADDPDVRVTWFDQERERAFSVKYDATSVHCRESRGPRMMDPVTAVCMARLIVPPAPEEEIRVLVPEGSNLHLMTFRTAGVESLRWQGEDVRCVKLAVRTDRLDDEGGLRDEDPWNEIFVWVAERPHRAILRMEGRIPFGRAALALRERRVLSGAPAAGLGGPPPAVGWAARRGAR